jgi:fermentation-respiration switch protein FrsA (DUF1100 family)
MSFVTEDNVQIDGWFVPARSGPSDKTLIVCHGWGANRSDVLLSTLFLNNKGGFNLLYFDFRNHGTSGGTLSSLGGLELRDFSAALSYLKKNNPEASRWIGAHGFSMGGAVSILAGAHYPEIRSVFAESPPASFRRVVKRYAKLYYKLPAFPLVTIALAVVRLRLGFDPNVYSAENFVSQIAPRPLFLVQGLSDERMPPSVGRNLYARAGEPKEIWEVADAHHGEVYELFPEEYESKVLRFYEQAVKTTK